MSLLLFYATRFLFILSFFAGFVATQTTHIVQVGVEGSFYNPATISAQLNDTVTFVFAGDKHTVTQTSFDLPCVPLPGGFNSGLAGRGTDVSASAPSWDLHITNVSSPIWFFCESTRPVSHCAAGMVGVINPTSIQLYNQFVAAAKLVTGTPAPTPAATLSGIGAFATNSPIPTLASITSTSSSTSSVTPTSSELTASPPSSSAPSRTAQTSQSSFQKHKGGIIAGIVVGAIAFLVLLLVLYFVLKRQRDKATIRDFFSYTVPPPQNMAPKNNSQLLLPTNGSYISPGSVSSAGAVPLLIPNRRPSNDYTATSYNRHAYANVGSERSESSAPTYSSDTKSSDIYGSGGTRKPSRRQHQFLDMGRGPATLGNASATTDTTGQGTTADINTLAREVAAVLMQSGEDTAVHRQGNHQATQGRDTKPEPDGGGDSIAPPVYGST